MPLDVNHINWRHNPYTSIVTWEHNTLHDHTFWEIVLIVNGSAEHHVNGKTTIISRGDFIMLRPGDSHFFKLIDKNYKHRDIYVTCNDMLEICNFLSPDIFSSFSNSENPIACKIDDETTDYIDKYCNEFANIFDLNQNIMTQSVFKAFIVHVIGIFIDFNYKIEKIPLWLSTFLNNLNSENFLNKSITDLISQTGYSHTHFCRLFKQYMKQTFANYLMGIKIDYSIKLLMDESLSILDISTTLGYDSLSHYITSFKNRYGLTPNKYRKNRL